MAVGDAITNITDTIEFDPISRIEGHLGVELGVVSGTVDSAHVHGNLWRGFENFLIGREPNDAITFTQRICGVCPIPHGTASMFAVESVIGANANFQTFESEAATNMGVPPKAVLIRNLVYASEFVMSHITHFYHLAAPSYVQGPPVPPWTPYFDDGFYHPLLRSTTLDGARVLPVDHADTLSETLWDAVIKQYVKALRMRRLTFEAGALFAGRMPMVSSFVAGGVTVPKGDTTFAAKITAFRSLFNEIGDFVVKEHVPLTLALGFLYIDYDNSNNAGTNPNLNYATGIPALVDGKGYGGGCENFLAWGAFPSTGPYTYSAPASLTDSAVANNYLSLNRGYKIGTSGVAAINDSDLTTDKRLVEYTENSHYDAYNNAKYPGDALYTKPDRTSGYSWVKAPRWEVAGTMEPMEVGPWARMVVNELMGVNGEALATTFDAYEGYAAYAKADPDPLGSSELHLDPTMVSLDLAIALVRDAERLGPTIDQSIACIRTRKYDGGSASGDVAYVGPNPSTGDVDVSVTALLNYDWVANTLDLYKDDSGDGYLANLLAYDETWIAGLIDGYIIGLKGGYSTMDRLRGRALECFFLIQEMIGSYVKSSNTFTGGTGWLGELSVLGADASAFRSYPVPMSTQSGYGVSEAPRGALAHFVTIDAGVIKSYQCVVPTTWNASPQDLISGGTSGPMEQAIEGVPYVEYEVTAVAGITRDIADGASANDTRAGGAVLTKEDTTTLSTGGGVEAFRVAQSFDPCIACAIH